MDFSRKLPIGVRDSLRDRFTELMPASQKNDEETLMKYDLDRFIKAQEVKYEIALCEIREGRKRSHWIWYIFPQVKGLGFSSTSEYYGINGIAEAKEYMKNELLHKRLVEISTALYELPESDPSVVMGYPDDLKLKSSMTLFAEAAPEEKIFEQVLEKYFDGKKDIETLKRIAISVDYMRQSDAYTIANFTDSRELMYRAAMGVYNAYEKWRDKKIAILVGGGNNGGDGYALAGILKERGADPIVYQVSDKLSEDGKYYCDKSTEAGVEILPFNAENTFEEYDIIVDCILGTGFAGEVRGKAKEAIIAVNAASAYVISVDINSGLNGDTGDGNPAIRSDITVSIGYYKTGMFKGDAPRLIGKLVNADIGIELIDAY